MALLINSFRILNSFECSKILLKLLNLNIYTFIGHCDPKMYQQVLSKKSSLSIKSYNDTTKFLFDMNIFLYTI